MLFGLLQTMVLADAPSWLLAYCLTVFVVTTGKTGPSQHSREVVKEGNHTKVPNPTKSYGSLSPVLTHGFVHQATTQYES